MVFLIQNTQNRDTLALQVKLSELILALNEADNRIAAIEESSDEELQTAHEEKISVTRFLRPTPAMKRSKFSGARIRLILWLPIRPCRK